MAATESQVVGAEMERVLPKVETLFERDDQFFTSLEKKPVEQISARDMRIPLEIRPNGNTGYWNPEGGDLGRGDFPDFDKAVINSAYFKHPVEFSAKMVWATDKDRKSVVNAFRHALATSMGEFRRGINSQCMTDGTGTLATITSVNTTAGVDTYTCTTDGFGVKLLRSKQKINVYNSALTICRTGGGLQNEVPITFYDLANKQVSVPAVPGAVAGDIIVTSGLQTTPPVGMLGVKYHNSNAAAGTWLGFDRAVTPEIRANRVNANASALTLPLPRLAVSKIGDRIGIKQNSKLTAWCHKAQHSAYEELGFNISRIDKTSKEDGLDLYFNDNLRIAGAPLKYDYAWDRTRIDFIDSGVWGRAEILKPGFYTSPDDGQRVFPVRGPSGGIAASWLFYLVSGFNIFMNQPAGASYIDTLAVPAGY